MVTIHLSKFRRSQTSQPFADINSFTDADEHNSSPTTSSVSYVWLCMIVGAAVSMGITVGVGLDHAGVTAGAASWLAGAVAFLLVLMLLMTTWLFTRS